MALTRYGSGIIEMQGSFGGQYHSRDKSGNHVSARPRIIKRRTAAQQKQRNAFAQARAYSTDHRIVSYNIYRALNNLPMQDPPPDYNPPRL